MAHQKQRSKNPKAIHKDGIVDAQKKLKIRMIRCCISNYVIFFNGKFIIISFLHKDKSSFVILIISYIWLYPNLIPTEFSPIILKDENSFFGSLLPKLENHVDKLHPIFLCDK